MAAGPAATVELPSRRQAASSLPSTSTIRFVLLVVLVLVTSAAMGEYLALLNASMGDLAGQVLRCMYENRITPEGSLPGVDVLSNPAVLRCAGPLRTPQLSAMIAVTLAVVAGGYLLYAASPWWRRRRHRLAPLPAEATVLRDHLDAMVREIGLARAPLFLIAPYNRAPAGLAFGRRGRPVVQLNAGLVPVLLTDPTRFRTVLLHELAHVRNRDIGKTYFTLSIWRAFLVLALAPFAVLNVFPDLITGADRWSVTDLGNGLVRSMKLNSIAAVAALTALIYLARAAVLRSREHLADLTAQECGAPALGRILGDAQSSPAHARGWALLRSHPDPAQRLRYLGHPGQRYRFDLAEVFAAGVATAGIATSLALVGEAVIKEPMFAARFESAAVYVSLAVAVVYSALAALYFSVIYWRVAFGASEGAVSTPGVISTAAAMTLGILAGEPLSLAGALGGLRLGIFGGVMVKAGFVGGAASAVTLFAGVLLLARWTRDSASLRITRPHRPSLRAAYLTTTAIGGLALVPGVWIWYLFHGTPVMGQVERWTQGLAQSRGEPYAALPGIDLIKAQYAPLEFFAFVPFATLALALPWVYVVLTAQRRPAGEPGQAAGWPGPEAADRAPPVGVAVWGGLAGGVFCLVVIAGSAVVAGRWIGQIRADHGAAATQYLFYGCFHLAVAVSAVVATAVAARVPRLGIVLGLAASFFTATISAAAVLLGFALVSCRARGGPGGTLVCVAARAGRSAGAYPYLFNEMVMRAALGAVTAGLAAAGVRSVAKRVRAAGTPAAERGAAQSRGVRLLLALCTTLSLVVASVVTATSTVSFFGD